MQDKRRQEILDTAIRFFYENGYEKTSITDIANTMHVAQGLCYHYFPLKKALFDTAIDQYAQLLADRYCSVLERGNLTLKQVIEQMPLPSVCTDSWESCYRQNLAGKSG